MSAPDRIFANPYYGMSQHQTSGIWTLGNITGHGTEYILLDPNTRVVTVDQLNTLMDRAAYAERFHNSDIAGSIADEIRDIIGDVK